MSRWPHACLILLAALGLTARPAPAAELTPAERIELEMLKRQLAETERTAKTKHEAAVMLLTRTYPQAGEFARQFLADKSNRPARVAVAEAIAELGAPAARQEFIEPLLELLTGPDSTARTVAANALSAYKSNGVLDHLSRLARDPKTDPSVRLAIIDALGRILDKEAIDVLVFLLGDSDENICNGACDALTKLTNIRAFGRDPARWRKWWQDNKNKRRTDWLADLAESLARTNFQLERDNASLRSRLAAAMNDLYDATPPAARDALLARMVDDVLPEVRLAGVRLTRRRMGDSAALPDALRNQLVARLADSADPIRAEAALLVAEIGPDDAAKLLADRLQSEQVIAVREALYQSLGLLRDTRVWDQLVVGLADENDRVATAAAAALARVAAKNGIPDPLREKAADALQLRHARAAKDAAPELREALVTAMGQLKDKRLLGLIVSALGDPAAPVRLSAIKAVQQVGDARSAASVAPLTADADRGVRLAAIRAVRGLGGMGHLETILTRTDPQVETDAAVRQEAWDVVMELLVKADTAKLAALADQLERRPDARQHLIGLLKLWYGKIPADQVPQWAPVRQRFGEALLAADRPAEAARELLIVYNALRKANMPDAGTVWVKWIRALLAADDPAAVARLAENGEPNTFQAGAEALVARVQALQAAKGWDALIRLAAPAVTSLAPRLTDAQNETLKTALDQARAEQKRADAQRVAALLPRLTDPDEAARSAAVKELTSLGPRAVGPLLLHLQALLAATPPNPAAEKAVLGQLIAIDPRFTGYDPTAPLAARATTVYDWLKKTNP